MSQRDPTDLSKYQLCCEIHILQLLRIVYDLTFLFHQVFHLVLEFLSTRQI